MTASTPYGRSAGSCRNVTPLALSSSYVLRQSSTRRPRPPICPFSSCRRTNAAPPGSRGQHERAPQAGLTGMAHGDPAKALPHGHVGAGFEAEDVHVEVAGLVLV